MADVIVTSRFGIDSRVYRSTSTEGSKPVPAVIFGGFFQGTNSVTRGPNLGGWKDLLREGVSATTKLDGAMTKSTWGPGSEYTIRVSFPGNPFGILPQIHSWTGSFWGTNSPTIAATSDQMNRANNKALTKFIQRVAEAQKDLDGLTFLGELGEALRGIRNPAQALRRGFDDYIGIVIKRTRSRKKVLTAKNLNGIISDTWLEAVFGWRPLISDIDHGAKALANCLNYVPPRIRVDAFGVDSEKRQTFPAYSDSQSYGRLKFGPTMEECTSSVHYYGSLGLIDKGPQMILERFGATWANVVPTLWELIPYSFVADYFTNIGDVISAHYTRVDGLKWVNRSTLVSQKRELAYVERETSRPMDPITTKVEELSFQPGTKGHYEIRTIHRDSYGGSLIPALRLEVPGMSTKWVNLAALFSSARSAQQSFRR